MNKGFSSAPEPLQVQPCLLDEVELLLQVLTGARGASLRSRHLMVNFLQLSHLILSILLYHILMGLSCITMPQDSPAVHSRLVSRKILLLIVFFRINHVHMELWLSYRHFALYLYDRLLN